jgi:small-conductance mechanosensitive channel
MEDQTFWQEYDDVIGAAITLAITFAIAYVVDRFVLAHAGRVADRVTETGVSRAAATRLRVVRRLVFVVIVLIGCFLALNEFTKLDKLATGLLASSAVLGIVLGLAARQVLANPLAGLLLAFTQPIRIGDTISLDDTTGRVADLTLSYTYIDPGDGRLMIIPNEHVVTSTVFNHSTGDRHAPPAAAVWLPPGADVQAARTALAPLEATGIELEEITPEGVRLVIHGPGGQDRTRAGGEEAALRERAHQLLLEAGILARADAG